jgi:hypothetical protein
VGGPIKLADNFIEKSKGNEYFIRNKYQISRLLNYHNLNLRLYNLDHKLIYLGTIQII